MEAVLLGPDGVCSGATPGTLLIDMSTIAPAAVRWIHETVTAKGFRMLDAPVSGGDVGAKAGTLSIMVGGTPEDFERARPVLEAMGKTITLCGPAGAGQLVKACNQIVGALVLNAISEAIALGRAAGVDPEIMIRVLQGGVAATRAMEVRGARMAGRLRARLQGRAPLQGPEDRPRRSEGDGDHAADHGASPSCSAPWSAKDAARSTTPPSSRCSTAPAGPRELPARDGTRCGLLGAAIVVAACTKPADDGAAGRVLPGGSAGAGASGSAGAAARRRLR